MESILTSTKKLLGIEEDYEHFDQDIIIHINTVFMTLYQIGVGPTIPYSISGKEETWDGFFVVAGQIPMAAVKSYMYLKVRLLFDPPNTGVLHEAMERQAQELEWRLNVQAETGPDQREEVDGNNGGELE